MHKWNLFLQVFLAVLTPILSEQNIINGGQCCVHSTPAKETLSLHGQHRFSKSNAENSSINDPKQILHHEVRKYRPPSSQFQGVRQILRQIVASDGRGQRNGGSDRFVGDGSRMDYRRTVRSQYNGNLILPNDSTMETTQFNRLICKDRENRSRKHSGYRFNTYLTTRKSHCEETKLQDINQVTEKTGKSKIFARNNINKTFKYVRGLSRQIDPVQLQVKNPSFVADDKSRDKIVDTYSSTQNRRKREVIKASSHILAHENIAHVQNRANMYRDERKDGREFKNRHITRSNDSSFKHENQRKEPMTVMYRNKNVMHMRRDTTNIERQKINYIDESAVSNVHNLQIRNYEKDSRNMQREGTNSLKYDIRKQYSNSIDHIRIAPNRENENENIRVVRSRITREKKYSTKIVPTEVIFTRNEVHQIEARKIRHDHVARNLDTFMIRNKRNTNEIQGANEQIVTPEIERYQSSLRRVTGSFDAHRRVERYIRTRNDAPDVKYEKRFRDNSLDRTLYLKRIIQDEITRKFMDLYTVRRRDPQTTKFRSESFKNINYGSHSTRNHRDRQLPFESNVRFENTRRITVSPKTSDDEERIQNIMHESLNIKNHERYSRDNNRAIISSLERGTQQRNSKRFINEQMVRRREEQSRNLENNSNVSIDKGYSRDNSHSSTFRLDSHLRQERIKRTVERQTAQSHKEQGTNIRNERINVRDDQRYSRDNPGDKTASLDRNIHVGNPKSTMERQVTNIPKKLAPYIRTETFDMRNYNRYSRDNTRQNTWTLGNDIRLENTNIVLKTQMVRSREEQAKSVRNGLRNIGDIERYSRNINDRTSILEKSGRLESARRITNMRVTFNRKEETKNIRHNFRDSTDNTRDKTSSLKSDLCQESTKKTMDYLMACRRDEQTINVRNDLFNVRHDNQYSRNLGKSLSFERSVRGESISRTEERKISRNRDKQTTNITMELRNIGQYERHTRDNSRGKASSLSNAIHQKYTDKVIDTKMVRSREEQTTNLKNELVNIRNDERYLIYNTRDTAFSQEYFKIPRTVKDRQKINKRDITKETREKQTRILSKPLNNRNFEKYSRDRSQENTIRNDERYSRLNNRNNMLSLERNELLENTRMTDRRRNRNFEQPITNVRNEALNMRNNEKYSKDHARGIISSIGTDRSSLLQKNRNILNDRKRVSRRKEQPLYVRNKRANINNNEIYSTDKTRDGKTLVFFNNKLIVDNREKQITNVTNESINIRNPEFYTRDNMRRDFDFNRKRHNMLSERSARAYIISNDRYPKHNTHIKIVNGIATLQENPKIMHTKAVGSRKEQTTNVRIELPNTRNNERYLGNNIRYKTLVHERSKRLENTKIFLNNDLNHEFSRRYNAFINTFRSSSHMESSVIWWQSLLFTLQGIYTISIFLQGNSKTSSWSWLPSFRLLKNN